MNYYINQREFLKAIDDIDPKDTFKTINVQILPKTYVDKDVPDFFTKIGISDLSKVHWCWSENKTVAPYPVINYWIAHI